MVNVPLLRQTLEHIENNPAEWAQMTWRRAAPCGTTLCFAGWASQLAGGKWVGDGGCLIPEPGDDPDAVFEPTAGQPLVHAESRGQRVLGLSDGQASWLFFADRNDVPRIVRDLIEEAEAAA